MNDITKLPKWAQENINSLELQLKSTERKLQIVQFESTKNGSGIIKMVHGLNTEVVLDDRTTIEFKLNSSKIRVSLQHQGDDYYVDVNGDSHISISPRAANSCCIR